MGTINCWEFKKCGRQPGGTNVIEMGVCPAATERRVNGTNRGVNGGRACWFVAGTLCGGQVQGSFATKLANCMQCEFCQLVSKEEGSGLAKPPEVLARLK